jgi:hypothetical protein
MKTLREYVDQLDEISRRDFLKGTGAAALGGIMAVISQPVLASVGKTERVVPHRFSEKVENVIGAVSLVVYYCHMRKLRPDICNLVKQSVSPQAVTNPMMRQQLKAYFQELQKELPKVMAESVKLSMQPEHQEQYKQMCGNQDAESCIWAFTYKALIQDTYGNTANLLKKFAEINELQESQLEETAAESDVDRVIQLAKEMR